MRKSDNPCFKCRDRKSIGADGYDCHPGCEMYAEFKGKVEADRAARSAGYEAGIVHRVGIMRSVDRRRRGK